MTKSIFAVLTLLSMPFSMASASSDDSRDAALSQAFNFEEIAARTEATQQKMLSVVPKPAASTRLCASVSVDRSATGAYYRKIQSRPDADISAFKGEGVLPRVRFDLSRNYVSLTAPWNTGPLDRPSVYMGIVSPLITIDLGFTWTRVYGAAGAAFTDLDIDGKPVAEVQTNEIGCDHGDHAHRFYARGGSLTNGTKSIPLPADMPNDAERDAYLIEYLRPLGFRPDFAFHPSWRVADTRSRTNVHGGPEVSEDAYFFPGDPFTMEIRGKIEAVTRSKGGLGELIITDTKRNKTFSARNIQIPSSLHDECVRHQRCSIKRVNSIDQFRMVDGQRKGNETHGGYQARIIPTKASAVGASWSKVVLIHRPRVQVTLPDGTVKVFDTSKPGDMKALRSISAFKGVKMLHSLKPDEPLSGPRCFEVRGGDAAADYLNIFGISDVDEKTGGESIDINKKPDDE